MANKEGHRRFGSIRKLKSGRYQARYRGPDGIQRTAPGTYERKKDAELFLSKTEADLARDDWFDPEAGKVTLGEFGRTWLAERRLAETTRERYEIAFRRHILPTFESTPLNEIREGAVRKWYGELVAAETGRAALAKAYRVLHAILNTAVDDKLIRRNPCRIKGANEDQSEERPVLTVDEVLRVTEATPARFRMMVLLATFTNLRFGELAALTRRDVDLTAGFVTVVKNQAQLNDGRLIIKDPKTSAGKRAVPIPDELLDELKQHLAAYAEPAKDGRVFVGAQGGKLRRQNFRKIWLRAVKAADVPEVHFHDLRHTGNTLAAENGATLRELMERMGHASPRAAMIYLHLSKGRSRHVADKLSQQIRQARSTGANGTLMARGESDGQTEQAADGGKSAESRGETGEWRRGDSNP